MISVVGNSTVKQEYISYHFHHLVDAVNYIDDNIFRVDL